MPPPATPPPPAPPPPRPLPPRYIPRSPDAADHLRLLFAPPQDRDVLIADEKVFYKAPKHLMTLAEPAAETLAVLVVVITILARPTYEGLNMSLLLLVLSTIAIVRWIREREWGWSSLAWAVVALYIVITNNIDLITLVAGVGLWFIARMGLLTLRWWRYEVRYLTNRRIVEATGFLGLRVASMPVTRVTDLVLDRTTWGETFGYGHLRIESAGQDQSLANIPYLVEPRSFHRLAIRLATRPSEVDLKDFIDVRPIGRIEKR